MNNGLQRFSNPLKLAKIVFMSFFFGENSSGFHHAKGQDQRRTTICSSWNYVNFHLLLIYLPGREMLSLKKNRVFIHKTSCFFNGSADKLQSENGNGLSTFPHLYPVFSLQCVNINSSQDESDCFLIQKSGHMI